MSETIKRTKCHWCGSRTHLAYCPHEHFALGRTTESERNLIRIIQRCDDSALRSGMMLSDFKEAKIAARQLDVIL